MNLNLCPEYIITRKSERDVSQGRKPANILLVHVMSSEVGFAMHLKESVDSATEWDIPLSLPGDEAFEQCRLKRDTLLPSGWIAED